jgi:hypothetical protein
MTRTYGGRHGRETVELAAQRRDQDIQYLEVQDAIDATHDLIAHLETRVTAMREILARR